MSFKMCPNCGENVISLKDKCPKCGVIPEKSFSPFALAGMVILGLVVLVALGLILF